jgi:hypothetical protein
MQDEPSGSQKTKPACASCEKLRRRVSRTVIKPSFGFRDTQHHFADVAAALQKPEGSLM